MDTSAKARRLEDLRRLSREAGVPLTVQRRAILEAILDLESHPTADEVHQVVARRQPGVSRATVYRTLESLVRLGLITKASHTGSVVRYDGRNEKHHHLVCLRCDTIIDVTDARLDAVPVPDTKAQGFFVLDVRVQLRGLCRGCRKLEEKR
jgi:Fe2+ or Zn2+ uptake regulation protein